MPVRGSVRRPKDEPRRDQGSNDVYRPFAVCQCERVKKYRTDTDWQVGIACALIELVDGETCGFADRDEDGEQRGDRKCVRQRIPARDIRDMTLGRHCARANQEAAYNVMQVKLTYFRLKDQLSGSSGSLLGCGTRTMC